ncbi:hypothetical protein SY88_20325 [Clostridiales bacterium PH28_bin88]|nr:hypothetical protein SY88_20325 [Clostridiales bacterium PH28_bin88]
MGTAYAIEPTVGAVISKALADKRFRALLYENHVEAIKGLGLEVTPILTRAFAGLNDSKLAMLAEKVDWRRDDPINQAIS